MYKHLFFLDSKTLDRLTPYILVDYIEGEQND